MSKKAGDNSDKEDDPEIKNIKTGVKNKNKWEIEN